MSVHGVLKTLEILVLIVLRVSAEGIVGKDPLLGCAKLEADVSTNALICT